MNDDNMHKYKLKNILPESFFSEPVYLDEQFILAAPEMPFTPEMIQALDEWGVTEVCSAGENNENYSPSIAGSGGGMKTEDYYSNFLLYTKNLFVQAAVNNELNYIQAAERIKILCEIIRQDRNFLFFVQKSALSVPDENYLASHSLKTAIISIIIGSHLKLPNHRLIELGVSALFHEIGMAKFPPKMYLSGQPLLPKEKEAMLDHPVRGYNILKTHGFPLSVMLAALEHHERENGSGYPRNLTGDKISLYGKIVAVACSYEAISAKRPHREAKDGYTGMVELLKNEGKQYDDLVVRALVYSLSIYPIGLHVLLSNGKKGQVISANPDDPRFPVVQVFGELTPEGTRVQLQTSQDGVSIVRPMTKEEIGVV